MHFNRSTSIILFGDEQLLSSCGHTSWSWLLLHLQYTLVVSSCILQVPTALLFYFGKYLWVRYQRAGDQHVENFSVDEQDHSRSGTFRRCMIDDMQSIFFYIFVAFFFTCLVDNRAIEPVTIARWLIEASWMPYTLLTMSFIYANFSAESLVVIDLPFTPPLRHMIKVNLFVWMRYTELHPSSKLNDIRTLFFYIFCDNFRLHQMPDSHWLRQFIYGTDN